MDFIFNYVGCRVIEISTMTGVLSCTTKVNFIEYVMSIRMKNDVRYSIRKKFCICTKRFIYLCRYLVNICEAG